ncbi:MAG: hypothetical protein AB8G86_01625 [Saprospiraceae bacterium]
MVEWLNQVDLANDSLIPLGIEGSNLNPLGYNVEDDFIYAIRFGTTYSSFFSFG